MHSFALGKLFHNLQEVAVWWFSGQKSLFNLRVLLRNECSQFYIKCEKTKQKQQQQKFNPFVITLESNIDPAMCPVATLHRYLHSLGPLLQFVGKNPVTYSYVSAQLCAAATFTGLNPNLNKGHSFRIGAAIYMPQVQVILIILSNNQADAFHRYIRIPALNL